MWTCSLCFFGIQRWWNFWWQVLHVQCLRVLLLQRFLQTERLYPFYLQTFLFFKLVLDAAFSSLLRFLSIFLFSSNLISFLDGRIVKLWQKIPVLLDACFWNQASLEFYYFWTDLVVDFWIETAEHYLFRKTCFFRWKTYLLILLSICKNNNMWFTYIITRFYSYRWIFVRTDAI